MASSERDFDVIVVGGGGAGLAAATIAADSGANVMLVEAGAKAGGSTSLSGGVFWASGTSVQKSAGIEDNPADQFRYYMNVNQHKLEASLVKRLCYESGPVLEWLLSLGVQFRKEDLYISGVDGIPRGHRCAGMGAQIAEVLEGSLTGKTVEKAYATRVQKLLSDGKGGIEGIVVEGQEIRAGAVILATGGFGANTRLLAELYPEAVKEASMNWYIGSPHSKGDGLEMGQAVGADIIGRNRGLILLTPGFAKDLEPYLPGWLVHINRQGRRFINETTEYSVLAEVLKEQTAGECFALFDEASRRIAKPVPAPNWSADRLAQLTQQGYLATADDLATLAEKIGVRADTLATTIETYNRDCDSGADEMFFKRKDALQPVRTPPFYAARIRPAVVCWTGTGLRIDKEARVLDKADRPIRGLYAAGETTGGMFGECYAGGGASIANAVIFGRVAGRNAALASNQP
jgi:fumarate reductase flavoprotein subunit